MATKAKKAAKRSTRAYPINSDWFYQLLEQKQVTQRKLAAEMNLDPSAITLMFQGKQEIRMPHAQVLARVLGVPYSDVVENLGGDPHVGAADTAPVVGWVDGTAGEVNMQRAQGPRRVDAPPGVAEGTVALRYQTEGTVLAGRDGWLVFYTPTTGINVEAIGRWCVVTTGGKHYMRQVKRGYVKGTYSLTAAYAGFPVMESVVVTAASPILWIKTGA